MSLKVTTRAGRRVYRGAPDAALKPGACPHCFRVIAIRASGRRASHNDPATGIRCTGSGIHVGDNALVVLDDLPPVNVPPRPAVGLGRSTQPLTLSGDDGIPYDGGSDREALNGRAVCSSCKRHMPLNTDGTIRRHRSRHLDPLAPYCETT